MEGKLNVRFEEIHDKAYKLEKNSGNTADDR